jgi:hypothetical protein
MTTIEAAPVSNAALWSGRVMSALVVLFLIFDAVIKLIPIQPVTETMAQLGYPGTPAASAYWSSPASRFMSGRARRCLARSC